MVRSDKAHVSFTIGQRQLACLALTVCAAVAVVFGMFQLVEHTGVPETEVTDTVYGLLAAGLLALGALVIPRLLFRAAPPLLTETFPTEATSPDHRAIREREKTERFARWFIQMRWIAVLLASILSYGAVRVIGILPADVWHPILFAIAGLAFLNVFFIALVHGGIWIRCLLPLQVYSDLAVLAILLHFSGGVENPLALLALIHVVIGGILLSRKQCYSVAMVACMLLDVPAWAEWGGLLQHHGLLTSLHAGGVPTGTAYSTIYLAIQTAFHCLILFPVAYFVTALADRVRSDEIQLETMAEHAVAERLLLEQALETTNTGMRLLDSDLQPLWTNNQWSQWFAGAPPIAEKTWLRRTDGLCGQANRIPQRKSSRVTELTIPQMDEPKKEVMGAEPCQRVIQLTTAPLRDADSTIRGVVELAQDITEQKQTQARMLLAGKLAAIGELASNIAHEVNNPIAIISAKARLLLSKHLGEMSATVRDDLKKIVHLSDRVAHIAQGLLGYSRCSPDGREELDIRVPIRNALALVKQRTMREGVCIEERLDGASPTVLANANELEQVFLNLFLNALDAMAKGDRLRISLRMDGERVTDGTPHLAVAVEDTGTGIPKELREKVFEPFFTTKGEGRGTGLGLSICTGLIRRHGGRIDLESKAGGGARFTVTLPVARVARIEEPWRV